jgi:hypothetical protein
VTICARCAGPAGADGKALPPSGPDNLEPRGIAAALDWSVPLNHIDFTATLTDHGFSEREAGDPPCAERDEGRRRCGIRWSRRCHGSSSLTLSAAR